MKVNDIVLIEGVNKSKFLWNLGRIIEVNKGHDELVRSSVVKKKGESRTTCATNMSIRNRCIIKYLQIFVKK